MHPKFCTLRCWLADSMMQVEPSTGLVPASVPQVQLPSGTFPSNTTFYTHLDANGQPTLGQDSLPFSLYPYSVTGNQPEQVGWQNPSAKHSTGSVQPLQQRHCPITSLRNGGNTGCALSCLQSSAGPSQIQLTSRC